ncbi:PRC-barrel domain-containing protein [Actinomadura sp. ATCC 31491]|uniref:PRC-barrel domain-containing protein n=1 Tax=Actinomadura luzonensis TaxID=2805427 RepID=A0ABT0FNE3_9ACTN|nr:PRC-barrel domain-containing protein [Actinomadura luzonensis]MCK2213418.1 PRC-barrel domain-containing protein [Actinomadura luzonensis]
MTTENLWRYRPELSAHESIDLVGYEVDASDGKVGSVDEANNAVGDSYVIVDTGPWIFGRKVLIPAGAVERIDPDERKLYIGRTKDEIKKAPEFDESTYRDTRYRDEVGGYYAAFPGTM